MISCGDFDDLKFLIRFFENLQKRPGQLRLILGILAKLVSYDCVPPLKGVHKWMFLEELL